jgi:hypothetical protein
MGAANRDDPAFAGPLSVVAPSETPRRVSQLLSGYLCGTHSGLLAGNPGRARHGPQSVAAAHRALEPPTMGGPSSEMGGARWTSEDGSIADELRSSLGHPAVLELILFGSQARGGVTGFSDVDAILAISDEAAEDPRLLRSLRPRVLAAQRAVLAYQPMQHHGFEVATPKLLQVASEALALPTPALVKTCSLYGRPVAAVLADVSGQGRAPLEALVRQLVSVRSWPRHAWKAHRLTAMFELLPVLYLQSRGRPVPKWQSFHEARKEFPSSWWPYEVLNEVRLTWPRTRLRTLEVAATLARNPWAAIAVWRRFPGRLPEPLRPLLTHRVLDGLHALARTMSEQVGCAPFR